MQQHLLHFRRDVNQNIVDSFISSFHCRLTEKCGIKKLETSFYEMVTTCKAYFDILNHLHVGVTREYNRDGRTGFLVANAALNYIACPKTIG